MSRSCVRVLYSGPFSFEDLVRTLSRCLRQDISERKLRRDRSWHRPQLAETRECTACGRREGMDDNVHANASAHQLHILGKIYRAVCVASLPETSSGARMYRRTTASQCTNEPGEFRAVQRRPYSLSGIRWSLCATRYSLIHASVSSSFCENARCSGGTVWRLTGSMGIWDIDPQQGVTKR